MTSSFKRPQHAFLPLHLDSLSSHLRLLTRLCVRLVTSNLSATAIFYPTPVPLRFKTLLVLHFIRQPFPGCSGCVPKLGATWLFYIPSTVSVMDPVDIADRFSSTVMLIPVDGLFLSALL